MRICFVTQEFPLIGRSGGIGTYVSSVASALSDKHTVTVLYCGNATVPRWPIADETINIIYLSDLPRRKYSGGINSFYGHSLVILDWLLSEDFDHVNFPDFQGLAVATLQARKSGMFNKVPFVSVTVHGPNRWALEANNKLFQLEHHAEMEFFERYSILHCDLLIFPSKFISDWVKSQNWEIASNNIVLQNPVLLGNSMIEQISLNIDKKRKTICFFGRLEPRKGVKNFLLAAKPYLADANFILVGGESPGNDPFEEFEPDSEIRNVLRVSNLNSNQAQSLFKKLQALVVVPSLSENCPYSIIETATYKNRIIASRVGGIPELLPTESLFDSVEELNHLFKKFIFENTEIGNNGLIVSNDVAIKSYQEIFSNEKHKGAVKQAIKKWPTVGVVVAHYNQADFLPKALRSIQKQTYSNFSCVVIDDGSNEVERNKFISIRDALNEDERFTFLLQDNSDVGATRNKGVEIINSEIVTFLDSDDFMSHDCLELYVNSFNNGARVVTSHFQIFEEDKKFGREFDIPIGTYEPFGACIEVLWNKNTVGGANFAIEKSLFQEAGRFNEKRGSTHQDWQILTRLALMEIEIDVVPKRLLNYRAVKNSMSRSRSHHDGQSQVINEYLKSSKKLSNLLLTQLMRELSFSGGSYAGKPMTYLLAEKIRNFTEKYFPINSLRWKILARIASRFFR